jgi:hypothetical protein
MAPTLALSVLRRLPSRACFFASETLAGKQAIGWSPAARESLLETSVASGEHLFVPCKCFRLSIKFRTCNWWLHAACLRSRSGYGCGVRDSPGEGTAIPQQVK